MAAASRKSMLRQMRSHLPIDGISGSVPGTIGRRVHWHPETITPGEKAMKTLAISLAVGASALFMTAASAAPLSADVSVVPESNVQNVRMVCNENGRCWRQRDERPVIIRERDDSCAYASRGGDVGRRGYDEARCVGFRAPGVSIGI